MTLIQSVIANWYMVLPVLVAFNILLTAVHSALGTLKGIVAGEKVDGIVSKAISIIQSIIDIISANKEHGSGKPSA